MSSKKATPNKSSNASTPKEKLLKLFSCGSSKKSQHPPSYGVEAPTEKAQESEEYAFVNREVVTVQASKGHVEDGDEVELTYTDVKLIGKGTFGIVYKARLCDTNETVAIKKVFDDKKYKNRELWFMKQLRHPNIIDLLYYFYSEDAGCRKGERYLNIVLAYMPETLFTLAKCDGTYTKPLLDPISIKVYTYQMFRCLNYLHSLGICHRDIKPQNLLIEPKTHAVKLCDFGSAKELFPNETNVAYICSRYYRAPELIYGAKDYTCQIDMWSGGCVLAELYQGHPIFPGATGPDQMVEIMKILGTPTYEDFMDFTQQPKDMRLPPVLLPMAWHKVFTKSIPSPDAMDLISRTLVFSPLKRLKPLDVLSHPFYDELRRKGARMADGTNFPPLFNFTEKELQMCPALKEKVLPQNFDEADWIMAADFSTNQLKDGQHDGTDGGGIKSKLVNIARSSFRRTSFKRDKSQQQQPQQPHHHDGDGGGGDDDGGHDTHGDGDVDDVSEVDISELASHARDENRWQNQQHQHYQHRQQFDDDDDDDGHHRRHHHHQHDLQEDLVDLSLNTGEKKKHKKKSKKKKSKSNDEDDEEDGDADDRSPPPQPQQPTTRSAANGGGGGGDGGVNDDDEDETAVKKKKHKRHKKQSGISNDDDDDDGGGENTSPRNHGNQDWGDVVGLRDHYGNDEFGASDDVTVERVIKKKGKKSRSKEQVFDLETTTTPSPTLDGAEKIVKKTKKKLADGSDVTRTVVMETTTTTTAKSSGKIGSRSKKKVVRNYEDGDDDEV